MSEPRRAASLEKFYDRVAPCYGIWAGLVEARAARRAWEVGRLSEGESVLEVAVGAGEFFALLLGTKGLRRCAGVDRSRRMLARACRRLRQSNKPQPLCRADAAHLPFADGTFDVLFNFYMLDLFSEGEITLATEEFRRVLRRGGRLVVLNMAAQALLLNQLWMWLYRCSPLLVGGCRPVPVARILAARGWRLDVQEQISQWGFRSDLIVAKVPERA